MNILSLVPALVLLFVVFIACSDTDSAYLQIEQRMMTAEQSLADLVSPDLKIRTCNQVIALLQQFITSHPTSRFRANAIRALERWNSFKATYEVQFEARRVGLYDSLMSAYRTNSITALDRFLNNWQKDSTLSLLADLSTVSDTVRAVYEVFQVFVDSMYQSAHPILILPNFMPYSVDDSVLIIQPPGTQEETSPLQIQDTILNFRPASSFKLSRVLYLDGLRESVFSDFLYHTEQEPRLRFLSNRVNPIRSHDGIEYFMLAQPMVLRIHLNRDLTRASVVWTNAHNSGSYSDFVKVDRRWRFTEIVHPVWVQ